MQISGKTFYSVFIIDRLDIDKYNE